MLSPEGWQLSNSCQPCHFYAVRPGLLRSSTIPSPTNQRNIRLYCICSINCRVVLKARLRRDADREQDLQQAGPDQPLRRDGGAAEVGIERRKLGIETDQRIVDDLPDRAQRVSRRDAFFKIDVAE